MKSDKLQDALGMIDPELIEQARITPKKKTKRKHLRWAVPVAACLAVIIGLGVFFSTKGNANPMILNTHAIAQAKYPTMAKYPASIGGLVYSESDYKKWREGLAERREYMGQGENLDTFFQSTASEFLNNCENDNLVYSPLNVYMALCMLAETSEGETRQQILDLLSAESIESLRTQAHAVWNANYCDDGAVTSILGSSLWLDESYSYNEETVNNLTDYYYASVFRGKMGSNSLNKAYSEWLNSQTGGILKEYTDNAELSPETLMNLVTTIYFQATWGSEFNKENNSVKAFHKTTGDVNCEFMNQKIIHGNYYWGEKFSATCKNLQNSGSMWFILPDEGVTVQDLLKDAEALSFMTETHNWEQSTSVKVNLSVPKFDVSSRINLTSGLKNLGVTSCFDFAASDFSPLVGNNRPAAISAAEHTARVVIDEEGVTAAAYTELRLAGAAAPSEEEIDFVLDRPFIFVITGTDSLPLFIGVVNNP